MGHIQIKRVNEHQWGVFASRPYTKGSTVISSSLLQQPPTKHNDNDTITKIDNPSPESCSHSIQIDWDKHILMELPARFLNHCCEPNIGVEARRGLNENGSYDFVALRDIDQGEVSIVQLWIGLYDFVCMSSTASSLLNNIISSFPPTTGMQVRL